LSGPDAVFLHGLAGGGSEWDRLQQRIPAEAPDLRDYGSRDEYLADVVELLAGRPRLLIGQSLGGHTAMLVAARHPDLVTGLVLIEASPARDAAAPERVRAFFTAQPEAYGRAVDSARAAAMVEELAARDWWDEWGAIRCRTLIVRGADGAIDRSEIERMQAENSHASLALIANAGHDVHLEQPEALAAAIERWR
jgi:pimeloyl-ACP methyl ester carboxylesterase